MANRILQAMQCLDYSALTALRNIFRAVVDWNPCGIAIMKTYKFGTESSLQGAEYSLPNLRWLAMHAEQVDCLPEDSFQPLSEHDR